MICTSAGNTDINSTSRLPKYSGCRSGDLEQFHARAGGHFDPGLQEKKTEIEEQNGPGHSERVSNRVPHRGIVVAE